METIRIILEIQSKKRLSTHSIQHQQTSFFIFVHHNIKDYKSTIYINRIVFEDAKRQLCKQFTTIRLYRPQQIVLFLKMLKDSFVSNSERYLTFVNYSLLSVDAIVKSLHSFHSFHNVKDLFNFA